MRALLLSLVAVLSVVGGAVAQTVRLDGVVPDTVVTLTRALLDRNDYVVLERDTLIGPDAVVDGDLIVLRSRVTLEGRVTGSVAVVEGEFYVRPRAVIDGSVVVLGFGGAFISGLATAPTPIYADPRNRVEVGVVGESITLRVLPPPPPRAVRLPNVLGLELPTYDRVDGLTLTWGPEVRFGGRDTAIVTIRPTVDFRFGRETFTGAVDVRARPSRSTMVIARAGRYTRTPDGWIRGPLANTLSSLLVQSDTRDYFESDAVSLTLARTPPPPIIEGEGFFTPSLTLRASRDRSLVARDVWSLFSDRGGWSANPAIDEGEIVSVVLSALAGWRWPTSTFAASFSTEWAPAGLGDHEFAQLSLFARFGMQALWRHQIAVSGYLLHPLGGLEAPLQRWSQVGGAGTLPAFARAAMRGDHVLFVKSVYLAPLRGIRLPLLGEPGLRFEHAAGAAWRTGDPVPLFGQNLGAGVQAGLFHVMLVTDPTEDTLRFNLQLGVQIPGGGVPAFPFF